jgi:Cu(I)/Ag(I) efflux system membrane fusion protein
MPPLLLRGEVIMNKSRPEETATNDRQPQADTPVAAEQSPTNRIAPRTTQRRKETRRWWIKLFVQPALLLASGAILIVGLGVAQRAGFIASGSGGGHSDHVASDSNTRYICPMMCTPPQAEPGRCPVCAMELVPLEPGGSSTDSRSIHIDPATRRVANIHTVAVTSMPMTRTIRAIGELNYDEGTLKTISAYVDGRLDRLYADYTGVVVKKGDHLAIVYSPRLYSGQAELLLAKKSRDAGASSTLAQVARSNDNLYASAKERLTLLGMTELQIEHLEEAGEATSQMALCAPNSGTVIEKMAVEGQYVKEGDAIYKLADLSTVWLMLKLFPEDAVTIRYGQKVDAEVQSLPGRKFTGRVAFIDPNVDPKTRTVGVRVVIPNDDGVLRVGDYAKATIDVPLSDAQPKLVYDPELANKWISPRHPHVVSASPGSCPICGVDLVPAAQFGFTDQPSDSDDTLAVPRNAVLMAGNKSVVYVETVPGRFEIRRVVLGPSVGDQIVIRSGVRHGELVATRGNFLIDSQMQLAGNPSLIDPSRLEPTIDGAMSVEMIAALSKLSVEDRVLVERQQFCPIAESRLGLMGTPKKVDVNGTFVFICCDACRARLLADPDKYLAKLAALPHEDPSRDDSPATAPQMDLPPISMPVLIEVEANDD